MINLLCIPRIFIAFNIIALFISALPACTIKKINDRESLDAVMIGATIDRSRAVIKELPLEGRKVVENRVIVNESWRNITFMRSESWGRMEPSVYTYVLAGEVGNQQIYTGSDERIVRARNNLNALVKEVRAFDSVKSLQDSVGYSNLFLVPARGDLVDDSAPYDFRLASKYREKFSDIMMTRSAFSKRLANPGPFLLATRKPIDEFIWSRNSSPSKFHSENSHIVLIDLSDAEPQSVIVFISIFKDSIRRSDVLDDLELKPLRAYILSALVRMNLAVPFIGSAYANSTKDPRVNQKP